MTIGLDLVNEDGALLAAMAVEVALAVALQIEPADPAAPLHGILPDPGVHRAALPRDVAWKSDIDR